MPTTTRRPSAWGNARPNWQDLQVRPSELCPRAIIWLPERVVNHATCMRPFHCGGQNLIDEGYKHPAGVLKIWQRPGSTTSGDLMVAVSDLTTFKNSGQADVDVRHWANHQHLIKFKESIPVYQPNESEVLGVQQLYLSSSKLREQSYVRLQHIYEFLVHHLWKYYWRDGSHAYTERLCKESYELLMAKFEMIPDEYQSAEEVLRTSDARLRNLADAEKFGQQAYTAPPAPQGSLDSTGLWILFPSNTSASFSQQASQVFDSGTQLTSIGTGYNPPTWDPSFSQSWESQDYYPQNQDTYLSQNFASQGNFNYPPAQQFAPSNSFINQTYQSQIFTSQGNFSYPPVQQFSPPRRFNSFSQSFQNQTYASNCHNSAQQYKAPNPQPFGSSFPPQQQPHYPAYPRPTNANRMGPTYPSNYTQQPPNADNARHNAGNRNNGGNLDPRGGYFGQ